MTTLNVFNNLKKLSRFFNASCYIFSYYNIYGQVPVIKTIVQKIAILFTNIPQNLQSY